MKKFMKLILKLITNKLIKEKQSRIDAFGFISFECLLALGYLLLLPNRLNHYVSFQHPLKS